MKTKESLYKFQNWLNKFMPYGMNIMEQHNDYIVLTVPNTSTVGLCGERLFEKAKAELSAFDSRDIFGMIAIGLDWTAEDYKAVVEATKAADRELKDLFEEGPLSFLLQMADKAQEEAEDEDGDEWFGGEDEDDCDENEELPDAIGDMIVQLLREALEDR